MIKVNKTFLNFQLLSFVVLRSIKCEEADWPEEYLCLPSR
jgi:hypothetical protein